MRGWIKGAVTGAVVLGMAGWFAAPSAHDWMLIRSACGGALPRDAVEHLLPEDTHLESEESRHDRRLGSYACRLTLEGEDPDAGGELVDVTAHTRRDDQDREFMTVFPEDGFSPQAPLPGRLPGFVDKFGDIQLMLTCPGLGEDAEGRPRKLLVQTDLARDAGTEVPGAAYETAVALTNAASDRLDCGAEPLAVPERKTVLPDPSEVDEQETVPLSQAGDSPCGWLTRAGLPRDAGWRVAVRTNGAGPSGRCDVLSEDRGQDGQRQQLSFLAWYGDWSRRLVTEDTSGKQRAATATARCDGEAASFAMGGDDDVPGVDEALRRQLFEEFARYEAGRRDCSGLRFRA